ncbi:MAG: hypothetical protein JWN26_150 [Candidatus Saccharibacteria bacterium]|nr:hypothetical protein [Candidatus Saccharibacteria bacterium]
MPKFMLFAWVKNVNKQRIGGGVKSVLLSPINKISVRSYVLLVGKVVFIQPTFPLQPTWFSTSVNPFLYLLNHPYTHNPQALLLSPLKRI